MDYSEGFSLIAMLALLAIVIGIIALGIYDCAVSDNCPKNDPQIQQRQWNNV